MKTIPSSSGIATGRNGTFNITAVTVCSIGNEVRIDAVGKRGSMLNAGLSMSADCATALGKELIALAKAAKTT